MVQPGSGTTVCASLTYVYLSEHLPKKSWSEIINSLSAQNDNNSVSKAVPTSALKSPIMAILLVEQSSIIADIFPMYST